MKPSQNSSSSRIADIIASRAAAGPDDLVAGWQNLLKQLLAQTAPYLRPGHLVTFRRINDAEQQFFKQLHRSVAVPPGAGAIYLPPSVRSQMMYGRTGSDHRADHPPDTGILLATLPADFTVIVNALFAKPPFTPAIDVYDNGRLLAGYVYNTINECTAALSEVLRVHLQLQAKKT